LPGSGHFLHGKLENECMSTPTSSPQPPTITKGYPVKFNGAVMGIIEDDVSLLNPDRDYNHFLQRIRLNEPKAIEMSSARANRW
jgi:hypothetical protein